MEDRRQNFGHLKGEYARPRRANPDTLSYLRSLPFEGSSEDDRKDMAQAAIQEIRNEMASLAAEGAGMLQELIPYTDSRLWFQELAPYVVFLSTHRYGSHVLQTLLMQEDSGNEELPSVEESLRLWNQAFWDFSDQLIRHGCASHVMRSLFLYWGGYVADAKATTFTAIRKPMQETLKAWVDVILANNVLDLCCHSAASPLMGLLCRICAGVEGMELTVNLTRADQQLGKWKQQAVLPKDHAILKAICEHIPLLVKHRNGSRVVDELLKVSDKDSFRDIRSKLPPISELIDDDIANFTLQTVIMTVPGATHFEELYKSLEPHLPLVLDRSKRRLGIVWRLAGASVRYNTCQDSLLKHIRGDNKDFVSRLLDIKPPNGGRLTLDVNGARIVNCLLEYDSAEIGKSLLRLSVEDLENLAKDGMGSRCVWDAILEGQHANDCKKLLEKLTGRWIALATDRIGHHCVRKMFLALPTLDDRETLVKELSQGLKRLSGNAMGRTIIKECAVEEYRSQGADIWRKTVKRDLNSDSFVEEIVATKETGSKRKKKDVSQESAKEAKKRARKSKVTIDSIMQAINVPKEKV